jgi:hypothetical protein
MQNSSRSESRSGAVAELYVLDTSAILAFTDQEVRRTPAQQVQAP